MQSFDYDLFVIGGGSGGVRAARVAASEAGAKVALAEADRYGGTCVIRGCVPKKLMVFASEFGNLPILAQAYGWQATSGPFDWQLFRRKLQDELDRLEGVYKGLLDKAGVERFGQRARLIDRHSVELADGSRKTARTILIASGGHPVRPGLTNAHLGLVSDDIFRLETLPSSILIVGGGYIACEFAFILSGLGVNVTVYTRGANVLRGFDEEASALIAEAIRLRGIDLCLNATVEEMRPAATPPQEARGDRGDRRGPIWTRSSTGHEAIFDAVLFATGRAPNTADMGLEEAGIKLGQRGEIAVDAYSRSALDTVFAIGDVTDRVNLTPVAIREGMAFVDTVFRNKPTPVDHDLVPSAVFTQPELGTVGLSEEAAREREPIEVYATTFRPMQTAFAAQQDRVMMKLIVSRKNRKVLGCHIVAPNAGEMIQLAGIAVKMGATKEDFDRTVAVHPTMSEEIVTMRKPVRSA